MQKQIIGSLFFFLFCYAVGILWQQNRIICLKSRFVLMQEKMKCMDDKINQTEQEVAMLKTTSWIIMACAEQEFIPFSFSHLVTYS